MPPALTVIASFFVIAIASRQIGVWFFKFKLPYITGYLIAGVVVGPFVLDIMHTDAVEDLHFIDEVSLAVIAFAAGSELHLQELRSRMRSILWNTAGLVIITYIFFTVAMLALGDVVPFMENLSTQGRIAVALMTSTIMIARSPASAIAIISELRARGPFTKTVLGVTVLKDVVIIVLFALNVSVATALLNNTGFDLNFALLLVADLGFAILTGLLVGALLRLILRTRMNEVVKIALILLLGFSVFEFSRWLDHYSQENLPFEILMEPLLVTLLGSFMVTNFSPYRVEFIEILEKIGPTIYIVFFTLVGVGVNIEILFDTLPITLALFTIRMVALIVGSVSSGMLAGDNMLFNRLMWMTFITQAGVALGLVREAADEFAAIGDEFVTTIIAVIVLNQIVGPVFFKYAIRRAGESHLPEQAAPDEIRDAVIFGVEQQSLGLARLLMANGWKVILADTQARVNSVTLTDEIEVITLEDISEASLSKLLNPATDAVIALMGKDAENFLICNFAYETCGIPRLVVRLNDNTWGRRFSDLGAIIVNPADAMVNLMDHAVRSPASAAMFMHRDPTHELAQVTITDPDIDNMVLRDFHLPGGVLVLAINRGGESIMPHGYTRLRLNDEVTLVGLPEQLQEVTLRMGF